MQINFLEKLEKLNIFIIQDDLDKIDTHALKSVIDLIINEESITINRPRFNKV